MPSSSAVIKSSADQLSDSTTQPPPLEGSASALVGNKLLVVGGIVVSESSLPQSAEPTNQVWMYDTNAKVWERWADFPIGICNHQIVAIDDNQVLVLGGENNCAASRHMDLYKCSIVRNTDGTLPTWTLIQAAIGAATSMPQARAFHTASTIRVRLDTIVFMYGGKSVDDEVLGDVWYLSLDDYAWSRLPSSVSLDPGPRNGCSSAVIGECVYIFGGQDREEKFRSDLWRYNTFDRLWHLCHDDNIGVESRNIVGTLSGSKSKTESRPVLPDGRVSYSMCSDLGNIWIYGGVNRINTFLSDMWCFSVTSQKWSHVEVSTQEELDGCYSAGLYVQTGAVTALVSTDFETSTQVGDLLLFGGRISVHGKVSYCSKIRKICSDNPAGSYNLDMTKNVSTNGKAGNILGLLRTRSNQNCAAEALDSAVCLLSHLDRLAGNDIPTEEADSVQLSRCLYRSLCIDPKMSTFSALYALLESITARVFNSGALDETPSTSLVSHELYPLLVTLKLLKLNFYEFSRSCLDGSEIGLPIAASQPGGVLYSIREILFTIADHVPKLSMSGDLVRFYHAVKQETALAIHYGFPALFPSLLDKLQAMNRLMVNKHNSEAELTPAQKLLIPMLVPCFTSTKMLFQLLSDPDELFKFDTSSDGSVSESVITFMSTLLGALRERTMIAIRHSSQDITTLIASLDAITSHHEFKCLNIMLRATIFWCSCSANRSWIIIESDLAEMEIRRVTIPSDLAKLFGAETLLVKVKKAGTASGVLEYDPRNITFVPSRTILSQHIYPLSNEPLLAPGLTEADVRPPPAPLSLTKSSTPLSWSADKTIEESYDWLKDLQKVIAWVGSHYAATLIVGGAIESGVVVNERWLHSPLFRGGLEKTWPDATLGSTEVGRNEALLLQVVDNVGNGKKLLDKVRKALDPGSAPGSVNPKLRAVKLKRQDSVEATLEKSGGIEAVDRAVRATFAALLKHTNISYTTEPISKEGALAEAVVDAWKAALQLRRWQKSVNKRYTMQFVNQ
ncbi:Hypothetical protein PHPALM_12297 [Phytophthora palmivora]|uniref:Uncharacterized protein n=1 Tax=Phytophthora palmivora TaxID=4796 RepID=A0A2P4Y050_9STRA|nr:Hypothetical protein PHPALM_12297 [Phytophthora palmivora]